MQVLSSYQNGNTQVTLYDDGSKEREYEGIPQPLFPESIDVKITNYCDAGCSFCHEKSTTQGLHGDLEKLKEILATLPSGVELAIGGGNPLSHPELKNFLIWMKQRGLIANITVNQKHVEKYQDFLLDCLSEDLIKGLGISYNATKYLPHILPLIQATDNLVFHVIMGINPVTDIEKLNQVCKQENKECKILILGYKHFGFGINYYLKNKKIDDNKYRWYTQLPMYFKDSNLILSFDNLAIKQLNLKRFFTDKAWETFYMGDDFIFTMYIDAVNQQFSPSSTSDIRTGFENSTLRGYFCNTKRN